MENRLFGEVRSLLARPPGEEVFEELVTLLDPFERLDEEILTYLEDHLSRWPSEIPRRVPVWWADACFEGKSHPMLPLCNHYHRNRFLHGEAAFPEQLELIEASPSLEQIHVHGSDDLSPHLRSLLATEAAQHVTALSLGNCDLTSFEELTSGAPMPSLTSLSLFSNAVQGFSNADTARLIASFPNLEDLDLSSNPLGEEGAVVDLSGLVGFIKGRLSLRHCKLTEEHLLTWPREHCPRHLALGSNSFTHKAIEHIVEGEGARNLLELDFGNSSNFNEMCARVIARTRKLEHLEVLDLASTYPMDGGVRDILGEGCFPALKEIDLCNSKLNEDAMRGLAVNTSLTNLRTLLLTRTALRENLLRHLEHAPHLETVRHMKLDYNPLMDGGARALTRCQWTKNLEVLELKDCFIDLACCQDLASCEQWSNLRELDLSNNRVTADGMHALVGSRWFQELERIDLGRNERGENTLQELARGSYPNLKELSLKGLATGSHGIRALASLQLPSLRKLDLSENKIGPGDLDVLLGAPWFEQLESLDLCSNPLEDRGLAKLAGSERVRNLRHLSIRLVSARAKGWDALGSSKMLGQLRLLILDEQQISEDALERILTSKTFHPLVRHHFRRVAWRRA